MNYLHPQYPRFTPLMRITTRGEESIISNIANGKWVRIGNSVLSCLQATDIGGMISKFEAIGIERSEAGQFLDTLIEYDFLDVGHPEKRPDKPWLFPRTAYLNVTDFCNMACRHCYYGSHPGLTHGLCNADLFQIVDSLSSSGIKFVVIAGGEPLTRPGIEDLLNYIRARQFHEVTLLTNGTAVTSELAEIVSRCVNNVHVSVDGPDEESNSVLRGKGNFDKAVSGIRKFRLAGVQKIRLITSITSMNVGRMHEMKRLCDELNIEFGTTIFAEVGRGSKYKYFTPIADDLIRFFMEEAISISCDSSVADSTTLDINAGVTCGSGTLMISVDCRGDVFPCHLFHKSELKIGNLITQPDLMQMLELSLVAGQFRARTVEHRKCHGCDVEYFCKGGCLAHVVATHDESSNSWKERDPFCDVHRTVIGAQLWGTIPQL